VIYGSKPVMEAFIGGFFTEFHPVIHGNGWSHMQVLVHYSIDADLILPDEQQV
jgi:hypothetical protein